MEMKSKVNLTQICVLLSVRCTKSVGLSLLFVVITYLIMMVYYCFIGGMFCFT